MQHFLITHIDLLKLFIYNYSITRFCHYEKMIYPTIITFKG